MKFSHMLALSAASILPWGNAAAHPAGPIVQVEGGAIEGASEGGVDSFKGVPFAAPPIGELRWRAPQPVRDWGGVRPATHNGNDCAQAPMPGESAPLGAALSEDCLYLNIWRPKGTTGNARLPVMVWIHGGGFVNGGASPTVYYGAQFARQAVIMVGINYRLGRFGFFAHPALTAENKDQGQLGNYGLMDEIAALKWVRRNIAAFGGDPAKVTIFGESAGGMSVNYLLASQQARGLFKGAIIQSGGGRSNLSGTRLRSADQPGQPSLERLGLNFAKANGIEGVDANALSQLRALPADKVVNGLNMWTMDAQADQYGGPIIDGIIVPESPDAAFVAGRQAKVPIIVGATEDDLGWIGATTKADVFAMFGSHDAAARKAFDPTGKADDQQVLNLVGQTRMMIEPARFVAKTIGNQGMPVFAYRFSYVARSMRAKWTRGAPHATDVPYALGTVVEKYGAAADSTDRAVGRTMNSYWVNFAKTGDPNGEGLPVWPRENGKGTGLMGFNRDGMIQFGPDPREDQLNLVEQAQAKLK